MCIRDSSNPIARQETLELLLSTLKDKQINKVIGVESRGFFFGILLAEALNAGFIPVRKPKKLPYETISATYDLEYGTDTLEIHIDAIEKGDRVLIHDDVLATGGTAKAVCELVERLGGEIAVSYTHLDVYKRQLLYIIIEVFGF